MHDYSDHNIYCILKRGLTVLLEIWVLLVLLVKLPLFTISAWISVLNNSKEEALQTAFGNAPTGTSGEMEESSSVRELRNGILEKIRQLPGNKFCCDCGAQGRKDFLTIFETLSCNPFVG